MDNPGCTATQNLYVSFHTYFSCSCNHDNDFVQVKLVSGQFNLRLFLVLCLNDQTVRTVTVTLQLLNQALHKTLTKDITTTTEMKTLPYCSGNDFSNFKLFIILEYKLLSANCKLLCLFFFGNCIKPGNIVLGSGFSKIIH